MRVTREFLSVIEVAQKLGVARSTVYYWFKTGQYPELFTVLPPARGTRPIIRVRITDLEKFLRERQTGDHELD
jgi:predicted site-specific integrase-resolvase